MAISGVRSWLVIRIRGPSDASWAAIRKPSASSATPSVTCQVGIARTRAASAVTSGGPHPPACDREDADDTRHDERQDQQHRADRRRAGR